jgi:2-iminoacetate synthase ThiH
LQLPPLSPEDYYFNEEGLMVFTAKYHLKRGYCCQNGCRHCPYRFRPKKEDDGKPKAPENQAQ